MGTSPQAFVFDLDGVLIQSEQEVNMEAAKQVFCERRMRLTKAELRTIPGKRFSGYALPLLAKRGVTDPNETDEVIRAIRARYDELWDGNVRIMPGAKKVVQELKRRGVQLGIATSNRRDIVERFYDRFGFRGHFDFAVTGSDVEHHKPHPQVYLIARACIGLPAENILAVEDTEVGVAAAKDAGLPCAALRNKFSMDHNFSRADVEIPALGMILSL